MIGNSATSPQWQPVPPPARAERDVAKLNSFWAYILTPGFTQAFHAATFNRSLTSIANYRANALKAAQADPAIMDMVEDRVRAISAEDGWRMAQVRGEAQMPYWSRLAMRDYRKRGLNRRELSAAFRCSLGTVANVLVGEGCAYQPFSGERRLTAAQLDPPGRWVSPDKTTHP